MNYNINKSNYHTFEIFGQNKLPYRAYFIPFASQAALEKTEYFNEREKSDKVTFLSGNWDFKFYEKVSQLADSFNSDAVTFDKITVPSCWSRLGYEQPCYINSRYPFTPKPPMIPTDIPVGVYRKKITITDMSKTYYITFLGVMTGFDMYVNGKHVGYSEGAHNSHEFDITKYLVEGDNELLAVVFKWSTGTYLECQDMFRDNGIFRDVYITENESSHIYDYKFTYTRENGIYKTKIAAKIINPDGCELKATLMYKNEKIADVTVSATTEIAFDVENAHEWSAEIPNLYTLTLVLIKEGTEREFIRQYVSFKTIKIVKDVFYFNDKPLKMLGVNHHDTHPKTAYCLSVEDIKKDITLMKEFNVNTVRTSHYPPDPLFLTFCDFYGLYIVDEADIETHGVHQAPPHTENLISNDSKWESHYVDRVLAMYERDKNHPCITMWSLGNESGGVANHDACYAELKKRSDIPVHYEAVSRHKRLVYDVGSVMYPSVDSMLDYIEKKNWNAGFREAPFFLCEYAHAMGVGPGSLDEYVEIFLKGNGLMGGCIWEWADHAVYHDTGIKYTYGGDHGEKIHDKNFCCDGLFYPDRTPSVSAYCMRTAYRPIRAKIVDSKLTFTNIMLFKASENIKIEWKMLVDGIVIKGDSVGELSAGETKTVNAPITENNQKDCYINVTYTNKKSGKLIAEETLEVNTAIAKTTNVGVPVRFECADGNFVATCKKSKIEFSSDGDMLFYGLHGNNVVQQKPLENKLRGFIPSIYRAPIDNYMYYNLYCKTFKLDKTRTIVSKTYIEKDGSFSVVFKIKLTPFLKLTAIVNYIFCDDGKMTVTCTYKNKTNFVPLDVPKLGLTFEMPAEYENVEYYGLGKMESYSDLKAQSIMGIYHEKKSDFYVDYIKPQDNGNRSKVRYFSVNNGKTGILVRSEKTPFNFKIQDVTTANLCASKHIEDILHQSTTIAHVDGFVRGIGSGSCGPDTRKEYKHIFKPKSAFEYSFTIEPITVTLTKGEK